METMEDNSSNLLIIYMVKSQSVYPILVRCILLPNENLDQNYSS